MEQNQMYDPMYTQNENINVNHTLLTNSAYLWPVTGDTYLYQEKLISKQFY